MRALFWTPEAKQDREDIYDYVEADNPVAALSLDELLAKNAEYLVEHPGLGRVRRVIREELRYPSTGPDRLRLAAGVGVCIPSRPARAPQKFTP